MGKYSFYVADDHGTLHTKVTVDLSRVEKNLGDAQKKLDMTVMTSMKPFMPHETGSFINTTQAMSSAIAGTGKVIAGAPPMGRFLYEGKVMVGERSRSAWAKRGEKKVVTEKNLTYSHGRTSHWFDKAKEQHLDEWLKIVKETAGGK